MHETFVITNPDMRRKCAAGMGHAMAMRAPGGIGLGGAKKGLPLLALLQFVGSVRLEGACFAFRAELLPILAVQSFCIGLLRTFERRSGAFGFCLGRLGRSGLGGRLGRSGRCRTLSESGAGKHQRKMRARQQWHAGRLSSWDHLVFQPAARSASLNCG